MNTCMIGDFNAILEMEERAGSGWEISDREKRVFRGFLENNFDIKIQGREFTWYRPNGMCKSRIDGAIVNDKWLDT